MGSLKDGAKRHGQLVGQSVQSILEAYFPSTEAGLAMAQLSVNKRDFEPLVLGGGPSRCVGTKGQNVDCEPHLDGLRCKWHQVSH